MAERKCCEPLVSIIIPVYNAGKFLKQCIESVIHQTYKNIEIILVNDGSTDKSGELCDAYAKKDVRIHVTHKENSGVVDARRIGSQQATGIYCTCVDSDDWISNDFVEKMMRIAETYHAPDWIACGYIQADEHGREIAAYPLELRKGYYSEEARVKEVLPCCITGKNGVAFSGGVVWGKLYKTELFRECQERVEPKLKYGEDFACATAVAYMCRTYYLMEDCMYYYRANPTSAVHVKHGWPWEQPWLVEKTLKKTIDFDAGDYREQLYRNLLAHIYSVVASHMKRKEPYRVIEKEVRQYLSEPYIRNIICNCEFSASKNWTIKKYILKAKLILPIYIWFRNK